MRDITRREFISAAAAGAAGMALTGAGILAPQRALGANDRLRVGVIGVGDRMGSLMKEFHDLKSDLNCEITAVCDIWAVNRDKAIKRVTDRYGSKPAVYTNYEELLAAKDIDAVIIATADFMHATMLRKAILAGKHTYCEKPTANTLEDANALIAVAEAHPSIVVQVGTQRRSDGSHHAAADYVATGALGTIGRVNVSWNYYGARWLRGGNKDVRSEDVDWKQFEFGRVDKPFDARTFREWRLFRPFSTGIPCQWLSHMVDAVHLVTGAKFPKSCVAQGGTFIWKDGRQNGDTLEVLFEYPEGFILNYTTSFGNGGSNDFRVVGTNGTLYGDPDGKGWRANGDGGGGDGKIKEEVAIKGKSMPGHMRNWVECVRAGTQPNATVMNGYQHSVALTMAVRALDTGRRQMFDPEKRTITQV